MWGGEGWPQPKVGALIFLFLFASRQKEKYMNRTLLAEYKNCHKK